MWLQRAERIRTQQRNSKNKLYALHAPEVECISKGKARNPYEFGVKVSLAAYFSDRGRLNQSDRGRCFSVIVDGLGRHTSPGLNVSQSSTISLKRSVAAPVLSPVLGFD